MMSEQVHNTLVWKEEEGNHYRSLWSEMAKEAGAYRDGGNQIHRG